MKWENRDDPPKANKYTFAQQNYEATESLETKLGGFDLTRKKTAGSGGSRTGEGPPSKLEPAIQEQ